MRFRNCPSKCSGKDSERQINVGDRLLKLFPQDVQELIQNSKAHPSMCGYCGCVYLYESAGSRVLGEFQNSVRGTNWY